MSEEDIVGATVYCSSEYAEQLEQFSELFVAHHQKMAEAERFAMAIGIAKNRRKLKNKWKDKSSKRKGTQNLATFEEGGKYNFQTLFEMLGLWDDSEGNKLTETISEYITGGMEWLIENEMIDGSKFEVLKEEFPDLFSDYKE